MFGVAGFFGTFIDYLRPTKSPYLVVILIAAGVVCLRVGLQPNDPILRAMTLPERLDTPGFFLPIFIIIFAMVPLSLMHKARLAVVPDSSASVENAKYENDMDGVFKFSRALCLAIAAIMLYVHFKNPIADNWYSTLGYAIILAQLGTFLGYMAFKHAAVEDVSNIGLFQIALITAVLFASSTFLATEIRTSHEDLHYFYYCNHQNIQFEDSEGYEQFKCNEDPPPERGQIVYKTQFFRPDFLQISFAVLSICWLIYEIFWLNALRQMVFRKPIDATQTQPSTG